MDKNPRKINEVVNKLNNVHKRLDSLEEKINKICIHCESVDNRLPERQKGWIYDGWSTKKQDAMKELNK